MRPTPTHPYWCEHPQAPNDATHSHTAAIGTSYIARDVTVDVVLVQAPEASTPMLMLHINALVANLSVDVTGAQAWSLAGLLIDATVAHARAIPHGRPDGNDHERARPTSGRNENRMRSRPASFRRRANRDGGQHGPQSVRRSFRCSPGRQRPRDDDRATDT